ncbi:sugar phosphate isomerase/epimerase family protein [Leucobacter celer]|uniref:sugar phosphate isomerase/epimerase family protein n=1 Tax=Leucobacter celer TaxID=668625 RepID=UPI0006A7A530|nr:sugar phosphate isomerase/epimerase family protein [Leucobacter celer]
MTNALPLGGTTYSWLYQASLTETLRGLAEAGFSYAEITTAAPHLQAPDFGAYERFMLKKEMSSLGISPTSVNPGFMDINLMSPSTDFREASVKHMLAEIELASDIEAPFVIAIPGRRHGLSPAPAEACQWWLEQALTTLLRRAEPLGVKIALETSPYGYMGRGSELMEVADRFNHPNLGIAYDCANTINNEDPGDGLRAVSSRLLLVHVSDTWRERWAHTSPGRGEVDFASYADAIREIGYTSPTIYELVDLEPPMPRIMEDIEYFRRFGWDPAAPAQLGKSHRDLEMR